MQRARIEDRGTRFRVAPGGEAQQDAQIVGDGLQGVRAEPALGLLIDGRPRREVVWHQSPARSGTGHPAQGIEDVAQVMIALRGIEAHQDEIGGDELPFVIADIGGVGLASDIHSPSIRRSQVHNTL